MNPHSTRTGKRGRPRDPSVIQRDEHVYQLIQQQPRSRAEIAELSGHDRTTIALSLQRLKRDERIHQSLNNGTIVWAANDEPQERA